MLAGACWWLPLSAWALTDAAWLYTVEVPVTAQSNAERNRAAGEGLLTVLARLTGLASVPRSAEITAALARPDDYYSRFVFFTERNEAGDQRFLRISFQADAIQTLIRAADLPVWWSKRQQVLAWIVVDDGGGRQILDSASEHPVGLALKARASYRGLPLVLPLMDLDDSLAVTPADVWGKIQQSLDDGAARYGAQLVLIGRVSNVSARFAQQDAYRGDWEIWLGGRPLVQNFTAASAQQAGDLAIDMLADRLAEQYAVLPRPLQQQPVAITGLHDTTSYAALMRYLESLDFIDDVEVTAIDMATLRLSIASRAQLNQLLMLLTAEGRLAQDKLHRGLDLQLMWQD